MTTLSKFFYERLQIATCQDIPLHSETCREHLIKDLLLYTLSNFRYFAPICLIPALIKIQTINKTKVRKTLEYYINCSIVGTFVGYSINFLVCLLRNIRGKFGFYSILFLPTFLGANVLYLGGTERVINLYETTIFQCAFETFLLMRKNIISRSIANSKLLQTLIFMACSAIILHAKQVYKTQGFWLLNPNPKVQRLENVEQCSKCDLHPKSTCQQYILKGVRQYFILGLSLDLLKMLMSQVNLVQNQTKLVGKLKNFRVRSLALLTAYIGIYRIANCWFNRKRYYSDVWNHIVSSFLAGSCYSLYPQSSLFSLALVQGTRSLWKIINISNVDTKNTILKHILRIPYARIIYPFALANMVHLVVMRPKYISNLAATVANGLTNNYPKRIQKVVMVLLAEYKSKKEALKNI